MELASLLKRFGTFTDVFQPDYAHANGQIIFHV